MNATADRNDVLEAFAAEPLRDETTLNRYIESYPEHALDLVELAFLSENLVETDEPLTEHDENRIESAWAHIKHAMASARSDALKKLTQEASKVASETGLPAQVITMTRERMIQPESLTWSFVRCVGEPADIPPELLRAALTGPPRSTARSFSSNVTPKPPEQIPLRRVLEEANVPKALMDELLKDD